MESSNVIIGTNTVSCFLGIDRLFVHFEKITAKYPSLNNHSLSVSHSFKLKLCLSQKVLTSRIITKMYFLRQTSSCICSQNILPQFHFITLNMKKKKKSVLKGHDLIKLVIFTASLRTFLCESGSGLFF